MSTHPTLRLRRDRPGRPVRSRARSGWIALGFLLAAGAAGCADSTGVPSTGEVRGLVLVEGVGLAGVTVDLSGDLRQETSTDETGRFTFGAVPTGAYVVTIRNFPPDAVFSSTARTAVIGRNSGQSTVTVDFVGSFIRTARIRGQVRAVGRPLGGVTVRLLGPDTVVTSTDEEGRYTVSGLRQGVYDVSITGFPPDVTFGAIQRTVQVATGETLDVDFDGDRELTATVSIGAVDRRLPSGEVEPVDPRDLRGVVTVQVLVDAQEETPRQVDLFLGEQLVGRQVFGTGGAPELEGLVGPVTVSEGEPTPGSLSLGFTVDTGFFDQETGEARFPNGESVLEARLATREGGDALATASLAVTLTNRDTFFGRVSPERGPVAGPGGEAWIGGDLAVRAVPVIYTAGRVADAVTVELIRAGGGALREASAEGAGPFVVTFPAAEGAGPGSLFGYQTPAGATDRFRVRSATFEDGGSLSDPVILVDSVRIDNVPPPGGTFALPSQDGEHPCCLGNWVGGDFEFASAFAGEADEGVGGTRVAFHAGPAGLSDGELLERASVARGGDLDASDDNATYRAVAVYEDALGNARIIPLAPSPGNGLTGADGNAVLGVDTSAPDAEFASSSLGADAVNPPSGSLWVLLADDRRSGLSATPARSTVHRFLPALDGGVSCVFPGGSACTPAADSLFRPVPGTGQGYFRYQVRVLDRAGNPSGTLTRWALRDTSNPEVVELSWPGTVQAGSSFQAAAGLRDNVDLHRAQAALRFAPAGGQSALHLPFAPPDTVGTPFDGTLIPNATARWTLPVVAVVEGVSTSDAPTGTLQPLDRVQITAWDVAGNVGTGEGSIGLAPGASPRSFNLSERGGDEGVRSWSLSPQGTSVCSPRSSLPGGGTCGSAPASIELRAGAVGRGGAFPAPFVAVHFYAVVDGRARWLGRQDTGSMVRDDAGDTGREWRWTLSWTPEADFPAGEHPLLAVGVDGEGNALRTREIGGVTVVGGS